MTLLKLKRYTTYRYETKDVIINPNYIIKMHKNTYSDGYGGKKEDVYDLFLLGQEKVLIILIDEVFHNFLEFRGVL